VSRTLSQCVSLKAKQRDEGKQQHHARDPHDGERNILPDRPVTQVADEGAHFPMLGEDESYFRADRKKFSAVTRAFPTGLILKCC
jgi:hypothetical protein